ncbi:MAG: hypothetical protein CMF96_01650 [Candidatus Marinimicrobia bacterium]|nr:hypothetical protein [Candidatus Neomarinimicrobiota bacterium]|tara:strand:- start:6080 stop:6274 length:195 start_codon:yes stop_codon:yes gene_type:complete
MSFKVFSSILTGMCLVGMSLGYVLGYYLHNVFESNYGAYLGAPMLGIGSGLILFGALFNKHYKT